jgi:hypothetical protein
MVWEQRLLLQKLVVGIHNNMMLHRYFSYVVVVDAQEAARVDSRHPHPGIASGAMVVDVVVALVVVVVVVVVAAVVLVPC